ncbi:Nramp family divalent metal transporter [Saccharopolyspora sp. SCSIO 74807]|uniref:Nramp family divalent metal transporter n=1 Tax=Saccharopolyspora sp. SCSIO 74807 TaxID=3118084 RepID=UPI0030D462F7
MSTYAESPDTQRDPYALTADEIREPPRTWRASLRFFGPGLIVSASVVGSGELIATTALGAEAGFAILWLIIVSTFVKVAVQIELARWTISTGQPVMTGCNKVAPRIGRIGWITVLWLIMAVAKLIQLGGVIGATATACSILAPVGGDPLGTTSLAVWTVALAAATIVLLYSNHYSLIERGAAALVAIFVVITVVIAAGLPFTPFAYGTSDVLSGLSFGIPPGVVGVAIAAFGITGIGSDEIIAYQYWCLEKGYARWTGPADGSDARTKRANGWIRVMYRDALLSWVVYTLATLAFFVMGAAVLHPQGLVPEGNGMLTTLSRMYTDTLGNWAGVLFLIGAIAVLGSTLWASLPSWARVWTNTLALLGVLDWTDQRARTRWLRIFTVALPITWSAAYLLLSEPVVMVQVGGISGALFLVGVVVAVWYLRNTETDPRLRGSRAFNAALVISSAAIGLLGVYTLLTTVGVEFG